jgi:oligopeptidase B
MQEVVGMGAEQTLLFGRSAGGYLVGSAIVRHPRGELFRGAYVEVPYVDVLRTAGNPDLPLTAYEYREFGDPAHRLEDFSFLLRHAPISGLGPDGAPGVTVLCRTSLNDRQVYAYESAKWVDALRGERRRVGGARPKWLAFQAGEGHFIGGVQQAIQRAEDFLLVMKNMMV